MNDDIKIVQDAISKFVKSLDCYKSTNYCETWNDCYSVCHEYAHDQMIENIDKFVKILLDFRKEV
jgi:hypothetical protein